MAGPHPEQRVGLPWLYQRWDSLTFLHWSYDPAVVQRLLPAGLTVHAFDGRAWVGHTPFLMRGARPPLLPTMGGWSTYPEINVRTYARGPDGRDGLFFLSLDTPRIAYLLARTLGLAYAWSPRMRWARRGRVVEYAAHRRVPPAGRPVSRVRVEVGEQLAPGELGDLDHFLTGRWRAYHVLGGRLLVTPVEHEPWPLWRATATQLHDELVAAAGLPAPEGPPLVHFSEGVDVRVGYPRPVRARRA
jgi:uncharacterized protein YqjF (DUF2071 family)